MIPTATSDGIKVPRVVVLLHRRTDGTIFTTAQYAGVEVKKWNTGLLRSNKLRSLDEAKKRINARLSRFCSEIVYVDPPGEAALAVLGKG